MARKVLDKKIENSVVIGISEKHAQILSKPKVVAKYIEKHFKKK